MLKNYLKIAYRHLLKNKVFSLINILGLAIGMAACLLIMQYVSFELSYDDFHEYGSDIYRVHAHKLQDNTITRKTPLNPYPLAPGLQEVYPEVINFTRLILPWSGQAASSTLVGQDMQGKIVKQHFKWGFYSDPGFLEMFSFPWLKGDRHAALKDTHQIILSESTARKLFGNHWQEKDDIIGRNLEYINEFDRFTLVIAGIMADTPANAHFQYDFLASMSTLSTGWAKDFMDTWDSNGVYTYLQLAPQTDAKNFTHKLNTFVAQHGPEDLHAHTEFVLHPLQDIYLHSHLEDELMVNGNAQYVTFLSLIAILILSIALINYMNLAIAKAVTRGNEVGIRKVMGAKRFQVLRQFLFESLVLNVLAFVLALTFVQLSIPFYTQLTGKVWNAAPGQFWGFILLLFPLSTLLSGWYPALVLSGYHPIQMLKGRFVHSRSGKHLRKGMVVFQFWVSIMLIIFTFTVYHQLQYMRTYDPGFEQEGVLVVKGPSNRTETWIEHDQQRNNSDHTDTFKDAASQYAGVNAISLSWSVPGERSSIWPIDLGESYGNSKIDIINVDNDYGEVYGLQLLAGEFDTEHGFVINESAAEILGYPNPAEAIGQVFRDDRNFERNIQGVVNDYHHYGLQHEIRPLMFSENDPTYKLDSYYSLKVNAGELSATIAQLDDAYKKAYPFDVFEYYFIDQYFDAQYREDKRFGNLFSLFSGLCIFIACLGLFGLSLQTIAEKTKEIGIRKVLGASMQSILTLLSRDFMKLVMIASLLAVPLAYWFIQRWLQNYAFHINISWWLLLFPVLVLIFISLLTVSFQTIRAALANPADALRSE